MTICLTPCIPIACVIFIKVLTASIWFAGRCIFPCQLGHEKIAFILWTSLDILFGCIFSLLLFESRFVRFSTTLFYNKLWKLSQRLPYWLLNLKNRFSLFYDAEHAIKSLLIFTLFSHVILITLTSIISHEPHGFLRLSSDPNSFVVIDDIEYDDRYKENLYLNSPPLRLHTHVAMFILISLAITFINTKWILYNFYRFLTIMTVFALYTFIDHTLITHSYTRQRNCPRLGQTCFAANKIQHFGWIVNLIFASCFLFEKLASELFVDLLTKKSKPVEYFKEINPYSLDVHVSDQRLEDRFKNYECGWRLSVMCPEISIADERQFYPFIDMTDGFRIVIKLVVGESNSKKCEDRWKLALYRRLITQKSARLSIRLHAQESLMSKLDTICNFRCIIIVSGDGIGRFAYLVESLLSNPLLFPDKSRITIFWVCTLDEYEIFRWNGRGSEIGGGFGRRLRFEIRITSGWDSHRARLLASTHHASENISYGKVDWIKELNVSLLKDHLRQPESTAAAKVTLFVCDDDGKLGRVSIENDMSYCCEMIEL